MDDTTETVTETENQEDTTTHTPNPSNPPVPPVDNTREVVAAYQAELNAQATRNRLLQEELDRKNAAPPKTPEQESQEYFANPKQAMRDEINAAVRPLNDFVAAQSRQNTISQIKTNMRQAPGFEHLDKVESLFDQYLAQFVNIDINNAVGSYNAAVGRFIAINGIDALRSDPKPVNDPPPNTRPTPSVPNNPPHVRPSPPPVNAPINDKDKPFKLPRPLNENEKKMARFNKMTDEAWWIETYVKQPNEVVKPMEATKR